MASKRKSCSNCASLRLQVIEKENEIKQLKKRIENLTNFVLWKDENSNNADNKANSYNDTTEPNLSDGDSNSNDCMIVEEKNKKIRLEIGSSNDFIYDKNYQMYYSVSTGYYYDDKSGLMYEPKSCTYYKYDYDNKVYEQVPEEELEKLGVKNDVWEFLREENDSETVSDENNLNRYDKSSKTNASQCQSKHTNDDEWENPSFDEVLSLHVDEVSSKTRSSLPKSTVDSEWNNPTIINENSNTVSSEPSKDEDEILYLGSTEDWKPAEGSKMTVTDMVKQVVEEHSNMSDYVYDETYRMYYSQSTGYYFDSVRNLLYDPNSGSYYSYDADKQQYEYYCQAGPKVTDQKKPEPKQSPVKPVDKEKLKSREMYWKKKLGNSKETADVLYAGMTQHSNEAPEALNNCVKEHSKKTPEKLNTVIEELLNETSEALNTSMKDHLNETPEKLNNCMSEHSKKNSEAIETDTDENSRNSSELLEATADCDERDSEEYEEQFSEPEDGEVFSSDEDSNAPICIVKSPVMGSCFNEQKSPEDSLAPSIRAIVENSDKLQIGSLMLITCSGGIIGRDKDHPVYIPDLSVSKVHAEIKYYSQFQSYTIEDLGSQNGTFINEKRLSEPKQKSDPCFLNHGDKLTLGTSRLLLHIHSGHDTCDDCEPGQVLAGLSSRVGKGNHHVTKEEMERSRREELRRIKKKYGLQTSDFVRKPISIKIKGYEDKAELRRQTVGSDNPYEKTQEASIDVSMPESNIGYQMLKKMGWKEGQTLGTQDLGLTEPIPLRPWTSKAGLGSSGDPSGDAGLNPRQEKRNQKWVKAQQRYFQLTLGNEGS